MNLSKLFREFFAPVTHKHEWGEWKSEPPGSLTVGPFNGVRFGNVQATLVRYCSGCDLAEIKVEEPIHT